MSQKSDLRVALFLYGQPRFVDSSEAYESIKENILDRYDTTVFTHAWFDPEKNYEPLPSWVTDKNGGRTSPYIPNTAPMDIITKYNPKRVMIEKPLTNIEFDEGILEYLDERFQGNQFYSHNNMRNIVSQLYSKFNSLGLVGAFARYDMFVMVRYDAVLIDFPALTKLKGEYIYIPEGGHFNDLIQISPKYSMLFFLYGNLWSDLLIEKKIHEEVELPIPELYKYHRMMNHKRLGLHKLKKLPMYAEVIRT